MKHPKELAEELLASITRDELIEFLEDNGIEVIENGSGKIIFKDN